MMVWSAAAVAQEEEAPPSAAATDPGTPANQVTQPARPPSGGSGSRARGGTGIALSEDGNARLHLGADAGVGFDTNPYVTPLASNEFTGDVVTRIRPRLELNAPGSMLAFRGTASLDYGFLPGLVNPATQSYLLYQSNIGGDLEVNRGGTFTFALGDSFSWNSDPGIANIGTLLNRIHNQARVGVGFRPGGGTLQFRLGYAFDFFKWFDVQNRGGAIAEGALDSIGNTLQLRMDYRFLPKTGVFAILGSGWTFYPFTTTQPQAFPVTALVGLQGQVLPKLAGLVSIGYENPLVVDTLPGGGVGIATATVIGVAGQAELQWTPTPTTKLGGGFQRRFSPTALYQYLANNRFYASLSQQVLGRFVLDANAGYGILEFGEEQPTLAGGLTDTPVGRLDGQLDGNLQLSYYFVDWFSIGIQDRVQWRVTNAADALQGTNFSYLRNETLVLASVWY